MRDKDVVITLLESLPMSYEYLISAMKTMLIKDVMMDYVTARLLHKMSKRKKKPQSVDAVTKATTYFCTKVETVFLLWQTGSHCAYLLQNKEKRAKTRNKNK